MTARITNYESLLDDDRARHPPAQILRDCAVFQGDESDIASNTIDCTPISIYNDRQRNPENDPASGD